MEQGASDNILEFVIVADESNTTEPVQKYFKGMEERHKGVIKCTNINELNFNIEFASYFLMKDNIHTK